MGVTNAENQVLAHCKKVGKIFDTDQTIEGFCPIHGFLNHFATKWSMLTILHIGHAGKPRFNELRNKIPGISQRMLAVTLRSLESDGLISRKMYPEIPPRVEYELTPLGISLLGVMMNLGEWANLHSDEIVKARKQFEKKKRQVVGTSAD